MFMMRNLSGPATMFEVDTSHNTSNMMLWQSEVRLRRPASSCPTGYVMTEFGCALLNQPTGGVGYDKPCPAGYLQTGTSCLPSQLPQTEPAYPQIYNPPAPTPPPLDQPSPGTIVYPAMPQSLPQIGSMMPKWALILAGGGTLLGLLALVLLRRR